MPRIFSAIAIALFLTLSAAAQETWQLDPPHSSAQFAVRHLGVSTVRGAFTKVSGTVVYDAANLAKSSVQVTIDATSVDTRVQKRDDDLRSEHFFDVQKFPTITFQSTKVEAAGAGKLRVTGDLTIRGVTKPVTLDVDAPSAPIKDPWGNQRIGASATTKINRMDFGVAADPGVVGDETMLTLDVEMIHK
jgi:polyisoprenoid-binding protein YceI